VAVVEKEKKDKSQFYKATNECREILETGRECMESFQKRMKHFGGLFFLRKKR
jgi:hypothetical protein